jgi:hypothetical protein
LTALRGSLEQIPFPPWLLHLLAAAAAVVVVVVVVGSEQVETSVE